MNPETRGSWLLIFFGSLGIMMTSTCYALSPEALALPVGLARIDEALALAGRGRVLALGGAVGVPADLFFAAAALVLARNTKGLATLGWSMGALSALVFTFADGLAARCLQPGPAFSLAKSLFDITFIAGTFAFGVATLLIFWEHRGTVFGKALLASGALGTLSALATLAGAEAGFMTGISIGLGVTLYAVAAALQLGRPAPAPGLHATASI